MYRILIVEDDPGIAKAVAAALQNGNWTRAVSRISAM